jgi:hypothetical protein
LISLQCVTYRSGVSTPDLWPESMSDNLRGLIGGSCSLGERGVTSPPDLLRHERHSN